MACKIERKKISRRRLALLLSGVSTEIVNETEMYHQRLKSYGKFPPPFLSLQIECCLHRLLIEKHNPLLTYFYYFLHVVVLKGGGELQSAFASVNIHLLNVLFSLPAGYWCCGNLNMHLWNSFLLFSFPPSLLCSELKIDVFFLPLQPLSKKY